MSTSTIDPADLAGRFQRLQLSRADWTHEAHLTVGLWHVATLGAEAALVSLRSGIRRLNEQNGVANTSTGGYHETITAAYVLLLDDFLRRRRAGGLADAADLREAAAVLLAGDVARRDVLLRYWSRERLLSAEARAAWVEPDVAPLCMT